ncbi:MAG: hypothetical protein U9P81_09955 [Euryarchaeota archaeon]|nr:hypothetical protein [Euryarchaeota archaeon]
MRSATLKGSQSSEANNGIGDVVKRLLSKSLNNFGHGKKNLSVVFAMLMMLAFLVDQTQQIACQLFRQPGGNWGVKETYGSK